MAPYYKNGFTNVKKFLIKAAKLSFLFLKECRVICAASWVHYGDSGHIYKASAFNTEKIGNCTTSHKVQYCKLQRIQCIAVQCGTVY